MTNSESQRYQYPIYHTGGPPSIRYADFKSKDSFLFQGEEGEWWIRSCRPRARRASAGAAGSTAREKILLCDLCGSAVKF
jgi:hypothetical protein